MLWFYGRYTALINSFRAGAVFRRHILTYKDGPRSERVFYSYIYRRLGAKGSYLPL